MQSECKLCGHSEFIPIVVRPSVPILQNRVYEDIERARSVAVGRLEIVCCRKCGFVFNRSFEPDKMVYDETYDNAQFHSDNFTEYMRERAAYIVRRAGALDGSILEVGCGQGTFLDMLGSMAPNRMLLGFDPSARRTGIPPVRIERSYFTRETARHTKGEIAAVVSRHVIEHVPGPVEFLLAIRGALSDDWLGSLFIETPSVDWIVEKRATYDFFYEHCNYFTQTTLAFALSLAGFSRSSIDLVFGDQYLWAESSVGSGGGHRSDHEFVAKAEAAGHEFSRMEAGQLQLVHDLAPKGLGIWGAGAKGVTFASILDPGASEIRCLIDINPQKQGAYVAGTGHQIVDAEQAWDLGVRSVVVMNPNYVDEVRKLTEARNLPFQVSSIDTYHG